MNKQSDNQIFPYITLTDINIRGLFHKTRFKIMNRGKFVFILTLFLYPISTFCQLNNYGLKLGIQSAGMYNNLFDEGRVLGFSLYCFKDFDFSKQFNLTIDLGATQRGFTNEMIERNNEGESIKSVEAVSKLTYISLASFINFKSSIASQTIYFGAAPRFDFLVHRKRGTWNFTKVIVEDELVNYFDKYIFGASFVIGIKNLNLINIHFLVEGKYETDITDSMGKYPAEFRNNVFMLVLGAKL